MKTNYSIKIIYELMTNKLHDKSYYDEQLNLWFTVMEVIVVVLLCFRFDCYEFKNCFMLIVMLVVWLNGLKCLCGALLFLLFVGLTFVWLYLLLFDVMFDDLMLCMVLVVSCFSVLVYVESVIVLLLVEVICLVLLVVFGNMLFSEFSIPVLDLLVFVLLSLLFLTYMFCLFDSELCLLVSSILWFRLYLVLVCLLLLVYYFFSSLVSKLFVIMNDCWLIVCLVVCYLLLLFLFDCSSYIVGIDCFDSLCDLYYVVSIVIFLVGYLLVILMVSCFNMLYVQCMLDCVLLQKVWCCAKLFSLVSLFGVISIIVMLSYELVFIEVMLCFFQLFFIVCNLLIYLLFSTVYCV